MMDIENFILSLFNFHTGPVWKYGLETEDQIKDKRRGIPYRAIKDIRDGGIWG